MGRPADRKARVAARIEPELHVWEDGAGPSVVCIHETAATAEVWRPLADALAGRRRVIAFDRPGWGASPAPVPYERTTVGEQANVAAGVIEARADAPAVVCGAGLGAVATLELLLRRPELVAGAVLVEPPLLAFVPAATDALSEAADLVREAVAEGGRELALERYAAGRLGALSVGAERIPPDSRATGSSAPASLFAELAAVPAWGFELHQLALSSRPSVIVRGGDTPRLLDEAARGLAGVLARSELRAVGGGLPHHDRAGEVAELVIEVSESG
jgi:pimeloyl-ACP methyl ester carboxylesterase